jgi:hypothetical protein
MKMTLVGRLAGNGGGTARTMLVPTMTPTNNPDAHATRRSTTRLLFSLMGFGQLRSLRSLSWSIEAAALFGGRSMLHGIGVVGAVSIDRNAPASPS